MLIEIPSGLTDDNDFTDLLNSLLNGLLLQDSPEEFWVVQIDNWFDHKWLRFSGNGAVRSKVPIQWSTSFFDRTISVKKPFWQDKLTFPPFSPERTLAQWSFQRSDEVYLETPLPKLPHTGSRGRSRSNLHRRAEDFVGSALFVWYSGNTLKNARGSVMVYGIRPTHDPVCWYASFAKNPKWALERTKGVDMEQVARLLISK